MHRPTVNELRIFFILLGIVVSSVSGGLLYYRHVKAVVRNAAAHEIEAIADIKAAQLARWRQKRLDVAKLLHAAPHTTEPLLDVLRKRNLERSEPTAQAFIDALREREQLRRVLLLDEKLRPVMSSPSRDYTWDDTFGANAALCLQNDRVMMSDIHLREGDSLAAMGIYLPLPRISPFGPHQGVLLMEFDPNSYIFPYLETWPTPSPTGETLLIRQEGDFIVALTNLRHTQSSPLRFRLKITDVPNSAAARALAHSTEVRESIDYRGTRVIAAARPIANTSWILISKRDLAEIDIPIQRMGVMVSLIVTGLILCGALGIGVIWRTREVEHTRGELHQREEAAEALRQSDQRYKRLFSEMILGFALHEIICDEKGTPIDYRFLEVNPAFEELTGLSAEKVIGRRVTEVMPDMSLEWIQKYGRVALTGEPCSFDRYKPDIDRHFEVRAYSPEPGKFAVLFQDTTHRVQSEKEREHLHAELLRKNEEMESLIHAASHDLRTPLVNIEGFSHKVERFCGQICSELSRSDVPTELRQSLTEITTTQLPSALKFIRSGVKKMNSLIAGLLHMSRYGKMEIYATLVAADNVIQEVATSHAFQLQKVGAELTIDPLPSCWCDASLLNQVFSNLLDNAIKYRDPERRLVVHVSGRCVDHSAVYCVEDNGIGIKPEHLDKIWELFHRLDPDGPSAGDGIGLSLVRWIVSRLHGRVWVESSFGKGSRFFIALPSKSRTTTSINPAP